MEWDGTRSDDGGGAGGVALDWVFTVEGGARVRVYRDSRGVMRGGRNESGWVGIGESLTAGRFWGTHLGVINVLSVLSLLTLYGCSATYMYLNIWRRT